MAYQRRGPRVRNNRKIKEIIKLKPLIITFSIIITLFTGILVYKDYKNKEIASIEQEKKDQALYILFEEIDTAARKTKISSK